MYKTYKDIITQLECDVDDIDEADTEKLNHIIQTLKLLSEKIKKELSEVENIFIDLLIQSPAVSTVVVGGTKLQ